MRVWVWALVALSFGLASLLLVRIPTRAWQPHVPKVAAQALANYLIAAGLVGTALALTVLLRQPTPDMAAAALLGLAAACIAGKYVAQIRAPTDALNSAFGRGWDDPIPPERIAAMLPRRWRWTLPGGAEPRWERDVTYASLPGSGRKLLADVWRPAEGVEPSGLGVIYVHGGYYRMLDKDSGTRPLFRHLARQGHVEMDISYRLVDETDIVGMVLDVKRAIAWLKDRAAAYGVDPDRIVVAGASSGGNLALLAGYTAGHPQLTLEDVADTSVRAVVAYYGVHDWPAFSRLAPDDELTSRLFGGRYEQVPERYELASPTTHVRPDSPTTLLVQGLHDVQHLIDANRNLASALADAGVRVTSIELPRTDHAFDLMPPGLGPHSPPSIAALYDLERFLAALAYEPASTPRQGRRS